MVSFDVPEPPDYGGAVDVYYKVMALAELGVDIHLHCFQYGRGQAVQLERICQSVQYYERDFSWRHHFADVPFIVASRRNELLIRRLETAGDPVLIEGLHNGFLLEAEALQGVPLYLRAHNVEHRYYRSLAEVSASVGKRWYLKREARKLERYEKIVGRARRVFPLSVCDRDYFIRYSKQVDYIPVFHSVDRLQPRLDRGKYALYHGNLSVPENDRAARYVVEEIWPGLPFPLVIAGQNAAPGLKRLVDQAPQVQLLEPRSVADMDRIIGEAHLHILPTFQATGMKLKLLHALFRGRHVVVNAPMITDPALGTLCHQFDTPAAARDLIRSLQGRTVTRTEWEQREQVWQERFHNVRNGELLLANMRSGS
ncbi:MAG: glycosyltransferase [Candidatus Neomarinimicrobiota bacterium]|nr:MAG: glycosyltransferase [Candidatus Neomarinimicrobiota bacterium]